LFGFGPVHYTTVKFVPIHLTAADLRLRLKPTYLTTVARATVTVAYTSPHPTRLRHCSDTCVATLGRHLAVGAAQIPLKGNPQKSHAGACTACVSHAASEHTHQTSTTTLLQQRHHERLAEPACSGFCVDISLMCSSRSANSGLQLASKASKAHPRPSPRRNCLWWSSVAISLT
jgi:hypothetical protein